jgi:hypothetical protein
MTPTTELEAVNYILLNVGERPVNSVDTSGVTEASLAKMVLDSVSREIQSWGLNCNYEKNYELPRDVNDEILLPLNTLQVDAEAQWRNIVQRGNKLYDKDNHTFEFTTSLRVNIVFLLPFTDLPQHVRHYITVKAARQFQAKRFGSGVLHDLTEQDEFEARAMFKKVESRGKDLSLLQSYPGHSIAVLRRRL